VNSQKDKNHIKAIKKLRVTAGDIIVVTLKNHPYQHSIDRIEQEMALLPFLKNVAVLVITDNVKIRKSGPNRGKHPVYLNNLEYLEYLSKKKEK